MSAINLKNIAKFASLAAVCHMLSACAPGLEASSGSQVAQAYDTSGIVPIPRYTRTIFSSNDF